jgi:uncharacterized membrane protein
MTQDPRDVPPVPPPPPSYPSQSPGYPSQPPAAGSTSTGLDPKLSGVLAYLFWIVGGILFLVTEKQNQLVRFHAAQSIVLGLAEIVLWVIVSILGSIPVLGFVFWLLGLLLWLAIIALRLFLMYKAYMLERFKLPLIGDQAEKLAAKQM